MFGTAQQNSWSEIAPSSFISTWTFFDRSLGLAVALALDGANALYGLVYPDSPFSGLLLLKADISFGNLTFVTGFDRNFRLSESKVSRKRESLDEFDSSAYITIDRNGNLYHFLHETLLCLNPNGDIIWKVQLDQKHGYSNQFVPLVHPDGSFVIVADYAANVFRFEANASKPTWKVKLQEWLQRPTISADGMRIYGIQNSSYLFCLDVVKGIVIWTNSQEQMNYGTISISSEGSLLACVDFYTATVAVFNESDGRLVWRYSLPQEISMISNVPVFDHDDNLLVVGGKKLFTHPNSTEGTATVVSFDSGSGTIRWKRVLSDMRIDEPRVLVSYPSGKLLVTHILDTSDPGWGFTVHNSSYYVLNADDGSIQKAWSRGSNMPYCVAGGSFQGNDYLFIAEWPGPHAKAVTLSMNEV
jgi:outer membrane protein assembly factor BamB